MTYEFQYRAYAKALYQALQDDAYFRVMEQTVENQAHAYEAMLKYYDFSIVEGEKYGVLVKPAELNYGVAVWAKPQSEKINAQLEAENTCFLEHEMGEQSLHNYLRISTFMMEQSKKCIEADAWYLSILGVMPQYQGQGLGPALVKPVLSQTDRLGVSTYLETFTPRNHTFYQRLGFKVVTTVFEPTVQAEYAIMKRDAQKA